MPPSLVWTVARGRPGRIVGTARDGAGDPLPLDGSEALRAELWRGDRQAAIADALTASHSPDGGGSIVLAIAGAASGALDEGTYRFLADVQLGGEWWTWLDSSLLVVDSAGADDPRPVYCSLQDVVDAVSWIQGTSARQAATDYASQRALARAWLDDAILKRIRPGGRRDLLTSPTWAAADAPDDWIAEKLAAGALQLDPLVVRTVAVKAAAFVAESRTSLDAKDPWPARAAALHSEARRLLLTLRCGLDLDGDGRADLWLHMGRITLR